MKPYNRTVAISFLFYLLWDNEFEVTQSFQLHRQVSHWNSPTLRESDQQLVTSLQMSSGGEKNKSTLGTQVNQDQSTVNPLSSYVSSLPFFKLDETNQEGPTVDNEVRDIIFHDFLCLLKPSKIKY